MCKKNILFAFFALLALCACREEQANDTLVSGAIKISVDDILSSSAKVTVSSHQEKVVSCMISTPMKFEGTQPYLTMDAVAKYNFIKANGSSFPMEAVQFRKLDVDSDYYVGAMGVDKDGNVITAPNFVSFHTGKVSMSLNASFDGRTDDGRMAFSAVLSPDLSTERYSYVFDSKYVDLTREQLLEVISKGGTDVHDGQGRKEVSIVSDSKKVMLAAMPYDMDGNEGELVSMVVAGEMTLVSVDLNGAVILSSLPDNENFYSGTVAIPAGEQEFTITINGVQYGATPYSGVAGVGTCTNREFIAYPAVGLNASQDGTRPLTYTVSKSVGRMSTIEDGGKKFWTNTSSPSEMEVRIDLSEEDGIPRYYFREKDAENVVFNESFDLFAYSGDYMKPANGCAVEATPDNVDGTEPGTMQAWNMTNAQGANKNEVGYQKTWFDWPEKVNGKVLANEKYILNRDMSDWTLLNCGEKVGALQLSVSSAGAFGVATTPMLSKLTSATDVTLEMDLARFSSSSKNKIAVRIIGEGVFTSGKVTVDGKAEVDLTSEASSKKEYLVSSANNICPPSKTNSAVDKPVSHFRFEIHGATPQTRISVDTTPDAKPDGSNANASRCYLFNLKVTR